MAKKQTSISEITIFLDGKQAEKAVDLLTKRIADLNAEKAKIGSDGLFSNDDLARIKEIDKEIKLTTGSINAVKKQMMDVGDVIRNVANVSENDLGRAMRMLITQTKKMDRSTQEYADKRKDIALLRAELDRINDLSKQSAISMIDIDKAIRRLDKQSLEQLSKSSEQLSKELSKLSPNTEAFIKKSEQLNIVKSRYNELGEAIKKAGKPVDTATQKPSAKSITQDMGSYSASEIRSAINELKTLKDAIPTGEAKKLEEINRQIELLETHLKSGNSAEKLKQTGAAIEQVGSKSAKASVDIVNIERLIRRLDKQSTGQLQKGMAQLNAEIAQLTPGTQRYIDKSKQLDLIQRKYNDITGAVKKQETMMDRLGATMKRLAAYVLVYAGFNKLTQGLKKMYDMNVALSDQLSDIEKTTGLTGQELSRLSDEINQIDTRSSVEELNKLAIAAGKLGITGKDDVMGFVKAGNIINVALGEDLGEDAIKNIAKLNDVLGVTKQLGVEKALLSTGSAINELGQSSTANEGYLVDFAQRLGGIAAQSGLTIQQILALGSASDQMSQNVEVSATAMNKLITTIVSKTGQVASAIGVTKEELQGVLDKSTWDALLLVFEKLAGKGGLAQIAPLMGDLGSDGARLTGVITALSSNTEKLNREISISNKAFAEAVSVQNEYEKKNNNLAGTIAKIGKNIKYWFLGSKFVDWMLDASSSIERFTRKSEALDKKFKGSVDTVRNLDRNIRPLLDEYERLKDTKTADEQERLKLILSQIASAIPGAVTEMDKYGNVLSISTDRAYAFIEAQKLILKQTNKDLIDDTQKTINRIKIEYGMASKKMKEIYDKGTYTEYTAVGLGRGQTFKTEYEVTDPKKIASVQTEVTKLNAELERQQAILGQLTGDYLDEDLQKIKELQDAGKPKVAVTPDEPEDERKKRIQAALSMVDTYIDQEKIKLIQARLNKDKFREEEIKSETQYNKMLEQIEREGVEKKLAIGGLDKDKRAEIERQLYDLKLRLFNKAESDTQTYLNKLDKIYDDFDLKGTSRDQRELIRIQQKYNDASILLEDALKKEFITQEEYEKQIAILRSKGKEAEDLYYSKNASENAGKEIKLLDQQQSNDELKASEDRLSGIYTEQEYKAKLLEIEIEYQTKKLAISGLTEEQITQLKKDNADRQIAILDAASRKQEQIQKQYESMIKNSLTGVGEAFGELLSGEENAVQSFGNTMVDVLFDVLGQLVTIWTLELAGTAVKTTAKAQMEAMATPDSVLTFGASGAARAAVMAGIIGAVLAVAKSGIKSAIKGGSSKKSSAAPTTGQRVVKQSGYAEGGYVAGVGGYTGPGSKYEVSGLVHKGEYVVPKWMMQSPVVMDNVRILETIRQTNKPHIPSLSGGYAEGGPVNSSVAIAPAADPELKNAIKQMNLFLQQLGNKEFTTTLNVSRLNDFQNRLSASVARGSRPK